LHFAVTDRGESQPAALVTIPTAFSDYEVSDDNGVTWQPVCRGVPKLGQWVRLGTTLTCAQPTTRRDANIEETVSGARSPNQRGDIVTFTVQITLGSPKAGVFVQNVFTNGGNWPVTGYQAGTARLDGNPVADPILAAADPNRVQFDFFLGTLGAGAHTLTYDWRISPALGCFTQVSNGVNLGATGVTGHLDTTNITFPVRGCFP
jgi:hypothetical protein